MRCIDEFGGRRAGHDLNKSAWRANSFLQFLSLALLLRIGEVGSRRRSSADLVSVSMGVVDANARLGTAMLSSRSRYCDAQANTQQFYAHHQQAENPGCHVAASIVATRFGRHCSSTFQNGPRRACFGNIGAADRHIPSAHSVPTIYNSAP